MAHRSGERPRQAPPRQMLRAAPRPDSRLLAPPPRETTQVRIRPLPERRPPRIRIRLRWYDVLCLALIAAALLELYARHGRA